MSKGSVLIAMTGIIAASMTIVIIVGLLANGNTNVNFKGKQKDTTIEVDIKKSLNKE